MQTDLGKNSNGIIFAGTRPEIIKLASIYFCAKENNLNLKFCFTGQQFDLGWQTLNSLGIVPEISFQTMEKNQSLTQLSSKLLLKIEEVINEHRPGYIIVQGDTSTVFCASVVGFYKKIDILHVEAGLRTNDIKNPFPEEFNRVVCSSVASYHFAVDKRSCNNLVDHNVALKNIEVIGNTVVDSLKRAINQMGMTCHLSDAKREKLKKMSGIQFSVITLHRREAIETNYIDSVLNALLEVADKIKQKSFKFLLIKHLNPALEKFYQRLEQSPLAQVFIIVDPLEYQDFVRVLVDCSFVITDSGGVAEEACTLGKPLVCIREKSERMEVQDHKNYFLTGFEKEVIKNAIFQAMEISQSQAICKTGSFAQNLFSTNFGSGQACEKVIKKILKQYPSNSPYPEMSIEILPATKTELFKKIVRVYGLGYVGLPTAILLANAGFYVIGIEIDSERVEQILNGTITFLPQDLLDMLESVLKSGALEVVGQTVVKSEFSIICVPTPLMATRCDLSAVKAVCHTIAKTLAPQSTIILESTISPGSCKELINYIQEVSGMVCEKDFFFSYCPERILPGNQMLFELENNARIIGCSSPKGFELACEIYSSFCAGKLKKTSIEVAEMVKLVENSSRNLAIAFANEIFEVSRAANLCPNEVIALANEHPRVKILNPGIGVGGHCIAVDPQFLIDAFGAQTTLLAHAFNANLERTNVWVTRICTSVKKVMTKAHKNKPAKVLLLGLAYKPNVPDLRESPALKIALETVHKPGLSVSVCEPNLTENEITSLGLAPVCPANLEKAIIEADQCVVLVAHKQFKTQAILTALQKSNTLDPVGILCESGCVEKKQEEQLERTV